MLLKKLLIKLRAAIPPQRMGYASGSTLDFPAEIIEPHCLGLSELCN